MTHMSVPTKADNRRKWLSRVAISAVVAASIFALIQSSTGIWWWSISAALVIGVLPLATLGMRSHWPTDKATAQALSHSAMNTNVNNGM